METEIIKQTFKLGNSAGVLLPKEWKSKRVRIQLIETSTTQEIFKILEQKDLLKNTKGIYLIGSYARGDYDIDSDIDVLIITDNINKLINENNYELTLISEKNFLKNLSKSLYSLSAIKDAKPIINKELLEKFKSIKNQININKNITEIKGIIKLNKEMINLCKESKQNVPDGTIYSLILRLRELYLLKKITLNKSPDKKEFLKNIGEKSYKAYLRIKRNQKEINNTSIEDALNLLKTTEEWLKELTEQKKQ